MKNKDKTKKVHESKIGKIIYGFLMFMPLMAILTTCLYAIFNKNAYQSYNDRYIKKEELVQNVDLLSTGNSYTANHIEKLTTSSHSGNYYYEKIDINWLDFGFTSNDYNGFRLYSNDGYITLYNTELNTSETLDHIWGETLLTFTFQYSSSAGVDNTRLENYQGDLALSLIIVEKDTIDNVFYYSIEQTENSNLFNWAKDSVIYTGMHDFTTQLNVSNTFLPMLLSYWLIVSIIYFLYDIALIMLNIVHRKIHELQDSL